MPIRKKILLSATLAFGIAFSTLQAKTPRNEKVQQEKGEAAAENCDAVDLEKVSQAFGHFIGKNLDNLGFEFSMGEVIKGMEDSIAGKESPMSEPECLQAISLVQEETFKTLANKNLEEANAFMASNEDQDGIVTIEKDRLQYKVEKIGEGVVVEKHFSPMIRYSGKFMDGKVFGASQEDELISLDETIAGFSQGIVGMREGEKRTIYIHPEFGYGTSGYLPPNSLLVFDIEVVKANAHPEQEEAFTSIATEEGGEIATSDNLPNESVR